MRASTTTNMHALVLSAILLFGGIVHAEQRVLAPGVHRLELQETHFLLERGSVNRANAKAALSEKLAEELKECTRERYKRESTIITALKWGTVGTVVASAFALGLWVGKR